MLVIHGQTYIFYEKIEKNKTNTLPVRILDIHGRLWPRRSSSKEIYEGDLGFPVKRFSGVRE